MTKLAMSLVIVLALAGAAASQQAQQAPADLGRLRQIIPGHYVYTLNNNNRLFNSGILANGTTFDYGPAPPEQVARARALAAVCARWGVPLKAAALQFPLRHPAVGSVVVGCRSPAEVDEDVELFELPIPAGLWEELAA